MIANVNPKAIAFWLGLGVAATAISLFFTSRYFGRILEHS